MTLSTTLFAAIAILASTPFADEGRAVKDGAKEVGHGAKEAWHVLCYRHQVPCGHRCIAKDTTCHKR
jgi:hypothetical protein